MKNQKQLIKLGEQLEKNPSIAQSNLAVKPRNYLALNPLLQKGGLHEKDDVEIGYETNYNGLDVVIAEKDLWYFEDDNLFIDVTDNEDEITYIAN